MILQEARRGSEMDIAWKFSQSWEPEEYPRPGCGLDHRVISTDHQSICFLGTMIYGRYPASIPRPAQACLHLHPALAMDKQVSSTTVQLQQA